MLTKRMGVALLILAVAGAGVWIDNQSKDVTAIPVPSSSPSVVIPTYAVHAPVSNKRSAEPSLPLEASLSEQVDRLMATHEPENAMAAYRLLADCDEFNQLHDRLMSMTAVKDADSNQDNHFNYRGMTESEKQHDQMLCAPMTERMRQSRIDYLAIAAGAGVSGASVSFAQEGPFGDRSAITSRPDDLLVRQWKETARAQLTRDAEVGDLQALYYVWFQNISGNALYEVAPALVLRYGLATGKIYQDINGANDDASRLYGEKRLMQLIRTDLSPEQRAAEVAQAQRIADTARQRRQHLAGKT